MSSLSRVVAVLGIDLAKRVFALHGVDAAGKPVLRKLVSRSELGRIVATLPPCLIGMEACSGAHEWARRFEALGHTARLMSPALVTPYRKSGKNDRNDAEATIGDARDFKNGRQLAAWLGLTPKQHSSGGKVRLGGITKHGNDYLRTLLIQGARAVMHHGPRGQPTRIGRWVASLQERRGYHKTNVALAAKNARIVWALLTRQQEFDARNVAAV